MRSCACTTTSRAPGSEGCTIVAKRSKSAGTLTITCDAVFVTLEPGMYRTISPERTPDASPFGATTTASRASSIAKVTVCVRIATGSDGVLPRALTVVPMPCVSCTVVRAPSPRPDVRTTPSVAVTVDAPVCASTRTWNAVPTTLVCVIGVSTT